VTRARAHPFALLAAALLAATLALALAPLRASAAPLPGSSYDSGDGNQDDGFNLDWQNAFTTARAVESADPNGTDTCFVGGTKENTPNQWAFNSSPGGCTPGKSNVRAAWANAESAGTTSFSHFAFWRNDVTGNSFLTFELNQTASTWTNAAGTTIPCRTNGDLLLSFESGGGSALVTAVYKWAGDGSGPPACPNGASGAFASSGLVSAANYQGSMNVGAMFNYLNPATHGASFPSNSFGEAAINLPAVLQGMGQNPCFGYLQMQVHTRSSSSISSALIDYVAPVPVYIQSCAATGHKYQDSDGDGVRDAGEPGLAGWTFYADQDDDGVKDAGEPSGTSGADGFYRILNVGTGAFKIREVTQTGWRCTSPSPCYYSRSLVNGGNSTGNDFGNAAPSTASGTKFNDSDADGIQDAGEPGLAGFTFYVDYDDDAVRDAGEPSATSDAGGAFSIADVQSGTFKVREVAQGGWTCSTPSPCNYSRTFNSSSAHTGLTFGNWGLAQIAGTLFEDTDGDGAAREAGEPALSAWQVYADSNGNDSFDFGEPATTTNASGAYTLTGLTPGGYTVRATRASASWYCANPGQSDAACERSLTLSSGESATGRDFGFARYGTVSGSKFDDANNNGAKDSGEPALAGFTFWVDYDNDNTREAGEPEGTSAADGTWTIAGVRAGSWTVREAPNGAYSCTMPSPCSYSLTLGSNGSSTGHVFGNFVVRSVSGVVFRDGDTDGLDREAGEPGLAGWTVYYDSDNDSVKDAGEPVSVTNSNGEYHLTGLSNGSYRIRVVLQAAHTCSFDLDCTHTGSLGNGQSDTNRNFGVWGPGSIAGNVFADVDADGAAKEPLEAGISGRTVYVDTDGDGTHDVGEPSTTSDVSGDYTLTGVSPGTHTVRQVVPAGWTASHPPGGSYSVTLAAGGTATGRNFGSYATGTIAGTVFTDGDGDGAAREAGEGGLAGRTVFLDSDNDGTLDGGEPSTTSDASGDYSFTRTPGTYVVRQEVPAGWTRSYPAGTSYSVTVTSGSAAAGRDFGSHTTGSIAGQLYEDTDFDGSAFESGDAPLSGRTVYLDTDGDRTHDAGEASTTTAGDGTYTLSSLAPGSYTARQVLPANWAGPHPTGGGYPVTVTSGSAATGRDFGSYVGASVSGTVFEDRDADGQAKEAGEGYLSGQRVYLDRDSDAVRDAEEPTTLTDGSGNFSFTGIEVQSWQLRMDLAAGWTCDSPVPCHSDLVLTSGLSVTGQDFGVHTTGSVSGHLFTDRDNDEQPQEFGEVDQPGRTVYVDSDDDGTRDGGEPQTTTDDSGNYTLASLAPGTYRIRQVLPSGWTCSTPDPCSWQVTVTSGSAASGKDFSSYTDAAITGYYYEDLNGDAVVPAPDLTDPPLAGRTVYVDTDGDDSLDGGEPQTTTSATGYYSFEDVAPGAYSVRVTSQPLGWTCSYPSVCEQDITVEAAETSQGNDFAAYENGTVSGVKFEDADADGTKDAGESGLDGWVVYSDTNNDGDRDSGEPSATTNVSGAYSLELAPGTYTIREVGRATWTCSTPTPCSHSVTVTSGGSYANRDFGAWRRAIEVTATDRSKVYGDGDPTFPWTITSGALEPGDSLSGITCGVTGAHDGVGSYDITCSGNTNTDYVVSYKKGTLAVTRRPLTVTAADKTKVYGSVDPALTHSITAGSLVGGDSLSGSLTRAAGESVAGGPYAITQGTVAASANYDLTFVAGQLTITRRPLTVTAADKTKVYGSADPALTHSITAGSLVGGDSLSGSLTRSAGETVAGGPYAITQGTLAASGNYDLTFVAAQLTITKRPITVAAADKTKVYGDNDPALTHTVTSGSLVGGDSLTGSLTRAAGETVAGGPYAITQGTLAASGNYDLTFVAAQLTITKRPLTVTAADKTKVYGDNDPALTHTVTSGSLVGGDSLTGSLTRAAGESVAGGPYAITQGTLAASGNYDLTFVAGQLTITKRPITITADDKTKVYGDNDPALTHSVTSGSLVGADSLSGSLTRAAGESVAGGPYAITQGTLAASGNYDLTFVAAQLTITRRPLTVTAADKTKVYGDNDPALTHTVTSGSLVGGDSLSGSLTRDAGETVAGGPYAITQGTLAASANYDLTFVAGQLTITKRPLTVAAADKTKVYGDNDPALTHTVTSGSLVGADSLSGSLTRDIGETVAGGPYAITQGTVSASANYDLTFVAAQLTITKRPLTVAAADKTKVYGDNDPALTHTITSGSLVSGDSLSGSLTRAAGETVAGGPYAITQGTLAASGNYDLTFVAAQLTITKRPITVTADDKSKVEGEDDPAFTWSITGGSLAGGDELTGTSCTVTAPHSAAGTYEITCSGNTNGNYDVTYRPGTLTVVAKPVDPEPEPEPPVIGRPVVTPKPTPGSPGPKVTPRPDLETGRDLYVMPRPKECMPLRIDVPIDAGPGVVEEAQLVFMPKDGGEPQTIVLTDVSEEPADGIWSGTLPCAADGDLDVVVMSRGAIIRNPFGRVELYDMVVKDSCLMRPVIAWVRGSQIREVRFYLDGRLVRAVTKRASGGRFGITLQRRTLGAGKHTLRAKVIFKGSAHRRPAVLSRPITRCITSRPPKVVRATPSPGCGLRPFLAWVRGDRIRHVVYRLDGSRIQKVAVADWGGRYALQIDPADLRAGRHVVSAEIVFVPKAGLSPRTATLTFRKCR
jgi:protocatechuate 3,4-dioxygenase beta subunit